MLAAIATDTSKSITQVAETTGVAESTIRGVYKDLHPSLMKIFPEQSANPGFIGKFTSTL